MPTTTHPDPNRLIAATPPEDLRHFWETVALTLNFEPSRGQHLRHSHFGTEWEQVQELIVAHLATAGPSCACGQLGLHAELACRLRQLIAAAQLHRHGSGAVWPPSPPDCGRIDQLLDLGHILAEQQGIYLPRPTLHTWSPTQWSATITALWTGTCTPDGSLLTSANAHLHASRCLDRAVEHWACTDTAGDHDPSVGGPDPDPESRLACTTSVEEFLATDGETVLFTATEPHLRGLVRDAYTVGEAWLGAGHRWLAALELGLLGRITINARGYHDRREIRCNDTIIDVLTEVLA